MLKANLEKPNSVNDAYLEQLIEISAKEIEREGITINTTDGEDGTEYDIEDASLITMYAAFYYRRRVAGNEGSNTMTLNPQGMPYMLRYALNNRLMSQKMRTET